MHFITEDIFVIPSREEKGIRRGMGAPNTVIINGDEETLVIDPGVWTNQLKEFQRIQKQKLINLNDVSKVLFTHQHQDHSIFGQFFQKKNNATLIAHPEEVEAIENEDKHYSNFFEGFLFLEEEMKIFPKWVAKAGMRYLFGKYKKMKINQTVLDGDIIEFDSKINVIELNSHTPGLIGFYLPETKILAVGDLIDLESGICLDLNSPISNFENGIKALEKIEKLDIDILIPGHGTIIKGKNNCKKIILERKEKSLQLRSKIVEILEREPITFRKLIINLVPEARNMIKYQLMKSVIYVILQSIYHKEGFVIKKKGYRSYLSRN